MKKTNWKRRLFKVVLFAVLVLALMFANALGGNPISKAWARQRTRAYYEKTYKESFIVYEGGYNMKIPAYVFVMGPKNDGDIRFDTALYTMGISDVYGGILAGKVLADDVFGIISTGFPGESFMVQAREEPLTGYANEEPNYFQADPSLRVQSNHFVVRIAWTSSTADPARFRKMLDEMAEMVFDTLPYITPYLVMEVEVTALPGNTIWTGVTGPLFPLF